MMPVHSRTNACSRAAGWMLAFCHLMLCGGPIHAQAPVTAIAFRSNGEQVFVGSQAGIEVRDWATLKLVRRVDTELDHVHDLTISPNEKYLLAAGGAPAQKGIVEIYDARTLTLLQSVDAHTDLVYKVAWLGDSKRWVSAAADSLCHVYRTHDAMPPNNEGSFQLELSYRGHSAGVTAMCTLDNGQTLATAGIDRTIQLWSAGSAQLKRTLDNHVDTIHDLAMRPSQRSGDVANGQPQILASVSADRTLRLWQPAIGRLMRFTRLPSTPRAVEWTNEGDKLIVACDDGTVHVLNYEELAILKTTNSSLTPPYEIALAPNADFALAGGQGGLVKILW